jgi:hypothetical protein
MTNVRIADPLASSPVDPTAHLDPDRVRRYAELAGDLPPVIAFCTDQGLILADGHHRVAAAQARGRSCDASDSDPAVAGARTRARCSPGASLSRCSAGLPVSRSP